MIRKDTRTILGLDIGVASIGWAVVELQEETPINEKTGEVLEKKAVPVGYDIIDTGVRVWQQPTDRMGKSLALVRGEARRARRTIRRRVYRMEKLVEELKKANLVPQDLDIKNKKEWKKTFFKDYPNVWQLRKESLERILNEQEFARLIYNIIKHRGFYFTSKTDLNDDDNASENTKVKSGISETRNMMKEKGYKTVGEAFFKEYMLGTENKRIRNGIDDYSKSIPRELLEEELRKIFKIQREIFNNKKASKELEIELIGEETVDKKAGLLYLQAKVEPNQIIKMIHPCIFEDGELAAPKKSYSSEKFNLLQKLNNLKIGERELTKEEIKDLTDELFDSKTATLKYKDIRKILQLPEDKLFNFLDYKPHNPEFTESLTLKKEEFDKKEIKIKRDGQEIVIDITKAPKVKKYIEKNKNAKTLKFNYYDLRGKLESAMEENDVFVFLEKKYQSTEQEIGTTKFLEQFEKDTFYEAKGYKALKDKIFNANEDYWEQVKNNREILNKIAVALCYFKEDKHRLEGYEKYEGLNHIVGMPDDVKQKLLGLKLEGIAAYSFKVFDKVIPLMQEKQEKTKAMKDAGYDIYKEEKPEIKDEYLPFKWGVQCKNPVVDRTYSQVRKLINAIQRKYKDKGIVIDQINIETTKELKNGKKALAKISAEQNKFKQENETAKELAREEGISPFKAKLLKRQQHTCVYCGQPLKMNFIHEAEIDHILPFSQSFDNSQGNKVIVHQKCNQEKRQRTPFEWKFVEFPGNKEEKQQNWDKFLAKLRVISSGMLPSQIRKLKNKTFHEDIKKEEAKFFNRDLVNAGYNSKFIVEYLKNNFYFEKSKRIDIKDKIQVRAGRTTAIIRRAWHKQKEMETNEENENITQDKDKDREKDNLHHAMDALVVAFATQGMVQFISTVVAGHPEYFKGGKLYKAFLPYKGCTEEGFENFKEDLKTKVENIFVSKMPRRTVKKDLHEDTVKSKSKFGENKQGFEVREGMAKLGTIVRGDFFRERTTGNIYLIPLYTHHFTYKKNEEEKKLPTITQNGDDMEAVFEEDTTVKDKKTKKELEFKKGEKQFEFMFSLYKDELVKYGKTKEDSNFFYVAEFRSNGSKIKFKNINGETMDTKVKDDGTLEFSKTKEFGLKTAFLEKYQIDMLGNATKVKQEKRVLNIRKKPKNNKKK